MAKKEFDYKFGNKYKFKDLKVYSSAEWMWGETKKYRQVFDKNEVDYIRAEFSFYNKLFDEMEWEAKLCLKAFALDKNGWVTKEICNQSETKKVKQTQNIVTFRKGWGTDDVGGFWKKGTYKWEAYIDEQLVGTKIFYVEDVGKVTPQKNPYFEAISLKVYNGPTNNVPEHKRKYLKKFKRDETQYVWSEFKFRNKINTAWNCELFFNFYDDAGQHKGQVVSFLKIPQKGKEKIYTFSEGWGTDEGGSWKDEKYTTEIVFMDTLVAVLPFEVGEEEIEGVNKIVKTGEEAILPNLQSTSNGNIGNEDEETLEQVMERLDALIGLQEIKKKIKEHIEYLNFLRIRKQKGFEDEEEISLHSVFTGNPGTGKTTVVNLLGKIYQKMGLLSIGHVHEVDRADLVGEFIGQTAPKVKKAIEEAKGGILFIDEAYMLVRKNEDSKDFGHEVIEVIVKEMSDGEGDLAIMVAGYPEEMDFFINSNPGLKSRFKYYFHFNDYYPDELLQIAEYACEKRNVALETDARKALEKMIVEAYRNRDKTFGNARFVYSLIDEGKMNLGLRLMKSPDVSSMTKTELSTIVKSDIEKINPSGIERKLDIAIDEHLLKEAIHELNLLIGLNDIKKEVNELIKLVRYYRESGKDVLNRFSLHTVFKGNPGTGKTTVARILGKIYKALGLLERGHIIECGREGLVAGYTGQTAIKTKEKIDAAIGGVMFIDEAYALSDGSHNDFGNEAIEVILKNMEDKRGQFAVIVAGYPHNMEQFLLSNPGLQSRFDRTFSFPDFSCEELYKIIFSMLQQEALKPDAQAEKHLKEYLNVIYRKRDKYFGNAREVRKTVENIVKHQHLRMASLKASERTPEMIETLTINDVKHLEITPSQAGGGIGFKY